MPGRTYPPTGFMMDSVALGLVLVVAGSAVELVFRCSEVGKRAGDFFAPA